MVSLKIQTGGRTSRDGSSPVGRNAPGCNKQRRNQMKRIIIACVAIGMFAPLPLYADAPGTTGTFDQCVAGDCGEAPKTRVPWCDAWNAPARSEQHARSSDCRNHDDRPEEPDEPTKCSSLWTSGVVLATREKQCA